MLVASKRTVGTIICERSSRAFSKNEHSQISNEKHSRALFDSVSCATSPYNISSK
jgi:hypothetical protein